MWLVYRTGVFTYSCFLFLDKKHRNWQNKKKNRKNQRGIFKKVKDSVMMEEIFNEDFQKILNSIKCPGEAVDVVSNIEKLLYVRNPTYYGLHSNKVKFLKNSKWMKIL